jgi:beta-glucosidase/6-phospho-beta-glucosidase/beta-galactosidase
MAYRTARVWSALVFAWLSASGGCGGGGSSALPDASVPGPPPADIVYSDVGSLTQASGKGSFRFGAASAATQIEDQDTATDWYLFTAPAAMGGLGNGTFVGDAAMGYTNAIADIELIKAMHLDSYRFSIEWARIEPQRDVIDEAAITHYRELLQALHDAGIRPIVTVHHFSFPVWIDDPGHTDCADGPKDTNLCGLGHPQGGPLVITEMEQHAQLLAERFGDLVDEWGTVNEPVNYLLAAYGVGYFPPGKQKALSETTLLEEFMPVVRDMMAAHARMYQAIKAKDTVDADLDGVAAAVGFSLAVSEWTPALDNAVSDDPIDLAARDRIVYVYHHMFVDSFVNGKFDKDLDGTADEDHPEWKGTIDWLGLQYYFRSGVSGHRGLVPVLELTPCFSFFDNGSCLPPTDRTFCVPAMGYEYYPPGLYNVLVDFGSRYPTLPLLVSESGIATTVGERRAENVVRALEQIDRARHEGVDVRGYYHWSLYDNFEWNEGFAPRFGLYTVNYDTYARTATLGATVLGEIAGARKLTSAQRVTYGGVGPMTPEPGVGEDFLYCNELHP